MKKWNWSLTLATILLLALLLAPHVAYFAGSPPTLDLYYATNANGTWSTELAGDAPALVPGAEHLGLALDGAGSVHAVYYDGDGDDSEVWYAYGQQPAWEARWLSFAGPG
jgi:hypothetical protein